MSNINTKTGTVETYGKTNSLYRDGSEIVMKVGEQGVIRLKPFAGSICELHVDNTWVALTTADVVDLRFALGQMLKDLGVENAD